jgi:hypothetical protein
LLNAGSDLIRVDSETGTIFVSKLKPIGTFNIKVIGTLPDFATSSSAIFKILVKENTLPVFSSPLLNI